MSVCCFFFYQPLIFTKCRGPAFAPLVPLLWIFLSCFWPPQTGSGAARTRPSGPFPFLLKYPKVGSQASCSAGSPECSRCVLVQSAWPLRQERGGLSLQHMTCSHSSFIPIIYSAKVYGRTNMNAWGEKSYSLNVSSLDSLKSLRLWFSCSPSVHDFARAS